MKIINRLIFIIICSAMSLYSIAKQGSEFQKMPLPSDNIFQINFKSEILENNQRVDIYLPQDYALGSDTVTYPVIYTLDGWTLSSLVSGVVGHLGRTASIPEAIVVSIHQKSSKGVTPQLYNSQSGWSDNPKDKAFWSADGGADNYLKFIKDELLPYIDNHYRTNNFRALISMSPTASFAMHSLIKQPKLFDAHFMFAATDVIGMGYTPDSTLIDDLVKTLAKTPDHKGFLYVASAKDEAELQPLQAHNAESIKDALAPFKNFKVKAEHIADFGHYPMAIEGLLAGLDLIFPKDKFDSSSTLNKMRTNPQNGKMHVQITQHYQQLSELVGFQVLPYANLTRNANCLRAAARMLRREERFDEAVEVGKLWLKQQPKSALAHYQLSESYYSAGNKEKASTHISKGLSMAKATNDPNLHHYLNQQQKIDSE